MNDDEQTEAVTHARGSRFTRIMEREISAMDLGEGSGV